MRIKLDDGAFMPERAHDTDAGLDLRSKETKVVPAGGSAVFDTGVHVELPRLKFDTYEWIDGCHTARVIKENGATAGFIKSKSGLNVKHNITSDGVIDMGYNGSIVVKLYNHGAEDYEVHRGDKISQLVIIPVLTPEIKVVDELEDTDRGSNGFGSTGR